MSEVTDSILFRQKLYDQFKESGLLSKLKTTLRTNLLQKLQKPQGLIVPSLSDDNNLPFHLRHKFLESIIIQHLKSTSKQYSLSIFLAESDLEEDDCLRFNELAELTNLQSGNKSGKSFLYKLIEEFVRVKCGEVNERSSQTQFGQPLSKKLEEVEKQYRNKIDYWKLIPNQKISTLPPSLFQQEEKLKIKFHQEKQQIKNQLQLDIKKQLQRKFQNQYLFRMKEVQKQHEARITEMKTREKNILEGLERKKNAIEEKAKQINEDQLKMINKYQLKINELEAEHRSKMKEIEGKQKEFWKKELELKAKKRQYEDTIRLVKQKVISQSSQ